MRTYVRKPPKMMAEQWDGTIEGFDGIRDIILMSRYSASWRLMTTSTPIQGTPYPFIEIDVAGKNRFKVYKNDYVGVDEDREFYVFAPEVFESKFKLKKEA